MEAYLTRSQYANFTSGYIESLSSPSEDSHPPKPKGTDFTTALTIQNIGIVISNIGKDVNYAWENIAYNLRLTIPVVAGIHEAHRDNHPAAFKAMINAWIEASESKTYTLNDLMEAIGQENDLFSVWQSLTKKLEQKNIFPAPEPRPDTATALGDAQLRFDALKTLFTNHSYILNQVNITHSDLGSGLGLNMTEINEIACGTSNPTERKKRVVDLWMEKKGSSAKIEEIQTVLQNNERIIYWQALKDKYDELLIQEQLPKFPQQERAYVVEMHQQVSQLTSENKDLKQRYSQLAEAKQQLACELKSKTESNEITAKKLRLAQQALSSMNQQKESEIIQLKRSLDAANERIIQLQAQLQKQEKIIAFQHQQLTSLQVQISNTEFCKATEVVSPIVKVSETSAAIISKPIAAVEQDSFMQAYTDPMLGNDEAEVFPLGKIAYNHQFRYAQWKIVAKYLNVPDNQVESIATKERDDPKKCWRAVNFYFLSRNNHTYRRYAKAIYDTYIELDSKDEAIKLGLAFLTEYHQY